MPQPLAVPAPPGGVMSVRDAKGRFAAIEPLWQKNRRLQRQVEQLRARLADADVQARESGAEIDRLTALVRELQAKLNPYPHAIKVGNGWGIRR